MASWGGVNCIIPDVCLSSCMASWAGVNCIILDDMSANQASDIPVSKRYAASMLRDNSSEPMPCTLWQLVHLTSIWSSACSLTCGESEGASSWMAIVYQYRLHGCLAQPMAQCGWWRFSVTTSGDLWIIPGDTLCEPNAGPPLAQCRRQWAKGGPTLG